MAERIAISLLIRILDLARLSASSAIRTKKEMRVRACISVPLTADHKHIRRNVSDSAKRGRIAQE